MENFDILEVLKKTLETKGIQYSENYSGSLNFTNWHNLSYLEKQEEIEYQYFEPGENFIIYSKSANGLVCELSVQGNFTIDYVIRMYKEKKNFWSVMSLSTFQIFVIFKFGKIPDIQLF